jgi:hypothetical protein
MHRETEIRLQFPYILPHRRARLAHCMCQLLPRVESPVGQFLKE